MIEDLVSAIDALSSVGDVLERDIFNIFTNITQGDGSHLPGYDVAKK